MLNGSEEGPITKGGKMDIISNAVGVGVGVAVGVGVGVGVSVVVVAVVVAVVVVVVVVVVFICSTYRSASIFARQYS